MVIIILGFLLVLAGLYFAIGGLGSAAAGGTALKGISIQGPSWLLLVALGVGTILFGAWLEHETQAAPKDKTETTVSEPSISEEELPDIYTLGDDADLDVLWKECDQGQWLSCDDLYLDSPVGSEYEYFGATCGYLVPEPEGEYCAPQNRNNGQGSD
jgi:hypothetical protein